MSTRQKSSCVRVLFYFLLLILSGSGSTFTEAMLLKSAHENPEKNTTPTLETQNGLCKPTPPDGLGPFYKPNAPERNSVGKGHILEGAVKSSADCSPIKGVQIEFWLAGPDGEYDDERRATVITGENGKYMFESNFQPVYSFRPPHIHIKVTAEGYRTLVTQYYPKEGQTEGSFDLVLIPKD